MGRITMDLYLHNLSKRYKKASKKEKGLMLDEYCATSGHSRKHAIKVINKVKPWRRRVKAKTPETRGKKPVYCSKELITALKNIWLSCDQMCGKRLVIVLPSWLEHYGKHYPDITDETVEQLRSMSSATIDRLLSPIKAKYFKGRSGTKPGSLIKTQIPIATEQWDNTIPGFVEADTVAHCGSSLSGDFVWSLTVTDICSGWTEMRATWGKGAAGTVDAITDIENKLPFPLKGFDCDNGSEFLNYHVLRYFAHPDDKQRLRLQFTRSRPYKKNDNAHVEQKNWTHVRQLLGYHRFEKTAIVPLLNKLYANEVSLFNNFFCPCVKLIKKERIGSKIKKTHSKPMTPYQRLLDSPHITQSQKDELMACYKTLDPFALKKSIEKQLKAIFKLVNVKVTASRVAI